MVSETELQKKTLMVVCLKEQKDGDKAEQTLTFTS